jgi:hypothetical protein
MSDYNYVLHFEGLKMPDKDREEPIAMKNACTHYGLR